MDRIDDFFPRKIEDVLETAGRTKAVGRAENSVRMGVVKIAVRIDHFRFDP